MSHYRTISVEALSDVKPAMLGKALKRMNKGYSTKMVSENECVLLENGEKTLIHLNLKANGSKVGLTVVGEFYHSGYSPDDFVKELSKNYTEVKIEEIAKAQKMTPVNRTVKANGDVVLRFSVAA